MHLLVGEGKEGLLEADPAGVASSRGLYVQGAVVVQVVGAENDVLHDCEQRVPSELLAIMEVDADEPCWSAAAGMHASLACMHTLMSMLSRGTASIYSLPKPCGSGTLSRAWLFAGGKWGSGHLMFAYWPLNSILFISSQDSTHPRPSHRKAFTPGHSPH